MIRLDELRLITNFYGHKTAERSGVPLIKHIYEGLAILQEIGASRLARRAYCLHPIFQSDGALKASLSSGIIDEVDSDVLLLVMEYRNQANTWLSDKVQKDVSWESPGASSEVSYHCVGSPTPGPLSEVRDMLIADKVQNYKDFMEHHHGSHARSAELKLYFLTWFRALGIQDAYEHLRNVATAGYQPS